ncbi:glutathione S-transferase family protein [Palleronia caenipelagi]|uniref:Glutathione S-transferase n=1 Tax=Palleronia caenipelagi TaxID=2489174 RepID=A0A547Q7C3_9RHOB|nr:glutathione S-transferase [Palleronia caenipelagi]TRD22287.1 glutathione S-transferase [Palleronia caenipelagi]
MTYQLHCLGESGHSYKVALFLELARLDWQPVFIDFFKGQTRDPAWRAEVNAMGEAPVLVTSETSLTQSGNILLWLMEQTGQFAGDTPEDVQEIRRWLFWDTHKMSAVAATTRFMLNFLPESKRSADVIGFHQARLNDALKLLENHLTTRQWLVGRNVTVADFACCSYLFYPEPFGFDRADWPAIDRWLSGIQSLDGWKHPYDLMPRAA